MAKDEQIDEVRTQIAQTVREREALKHAIEHGEVQPQHGLRELDVLDAQLSKLDTQFKTLWDEANVKR